MKKIILASAIFLATTGFAAAYTSPYLGVCVGVVNNSDNNFSSYRGVPFNVFAGYGGLLGQSFYLAGELTGTAGTANINDNGDLKSSFGFGGSILPGVMVNDQTMAFLRAGVVYARFPNASNNATWRTGGLLGLGLQTSLSQNLDLRGEYNLVAYESKNEMIAGTSFSVAPRSDQVGIGLVYRLD